MTIQEKFGLRVKELRLAKELSQEKLANIAEIDRTYMTSLENGRRIITIEPFSRLLAALDISCREFLIEGIVGDPYDWDEWYVLQNYIYFDMGNVVYLTGDQPTTCVICGRRTDIIFDFGPSLKNARLHQCFNRSCGLIFLTEDEEDEYD